MNLALIIEHYDPDGGGAERSLGQMAHHLVQRGHHVTVIAGSYFHRPQMDDLEVVQLYRQRRRSAVSVLKLARWARAKVANGRFDTSLSVTTAIPAAVVQPRSGTVRETQARNVALRTGITSRLLKRTLLTASPKQNVLLQLEKRTLRDPMVKQFVAVSQYVVEQLVGHYGIDDSRVTLIPNAAEMPQVDAKQRASWRAEVRHSFDVPQEKLVFLFAALNPRLKGSRSLLHAVRRLKDRGQDLTLLMAGRIEYDQQRLAAQLDIRDRVRFVGSTNRMVRLYSAADVTVHPTFYDPASKVVIESLMMGVPAITTTYNGASDHVIGSDHEPRGRVVENPTAIDDLAQAMAEMANPDERQRCAGATDGLAETLSMARHVDQLEAVLAAAAEGQPPTALHDDPHAA